MSQAELEQLLNLDETVELARIRNAIDAELTRRAGYALKFGITAPRRITGALRLPKTQPTAKSESSPPPRQL